MTDLQTTQKEQELFTKQRKYSDLMRKSFEISLFNRIKARTYHDAAEELYEEISKTRAVLNLA